MKKIFISALLLIVFRGCEYSNNDPVFDYNLKSAVLVETNNNFGINLLKEVLTDESAANVMISPASVSFALGMTYNGAESDTKKAFENIFSYTGLSREEVNSYTKELIDVLTTNSSGNELDIANSIWYQEGFPVLDGFIILNTQYYGAEVKEQDFSSPDAIKNINDWVKEKTNKKIESILNTLPPSTEMILINALYFNCVWEVEFDEKETTQKPFYKEDGSKYKDVDVMFSKDTYNYAVTDDFSIVELQYKNKKFSMILVLPSEASGISGFISDLDSASWTDMTGNMLQNGELILKIPKFKFSFDRSLKADLIDMGLGVAFTEAADFSGMSPDPLMIADVLHKTYIDVNEKGTEAAAVTAVVMVDSAVEVPLTIEFNRPFFFAIRENSSKAIIFAGKVSEPAYAD